MKTPFRFNLQLFAEETAAIVEMAKEIGTLEAQTEQLVEEVEEATQKAERLETNDVWQDQRIYDMLSRISALEDRLAVLEAEEAEEDDEDEAEPDELPEPPAEPEPVPEPEPEGTTIAGAEPEEEKEKPKKRSRREKARWGLF